MSTALLQLKIEPSLRELLKELADYEGLSLTAYAKTKLKKIVREEKSKIFTENGLLPEQELEILVREREALEDYKKDRLVMKSAKQIIKELHA